MPATRPGSSVSTSSQLLRRSSLAAFVVIATAVAMLGLLVAQTERQRTEMERMTAATHERATLERRLEEAVGARAAAPVPDARLEEQVREQRRLLSAVDDRLARMRESSERGIDMLILEETVAVILLLTALGMGVRLALRPAHARLEQAAVALAKHESQTRAVLDAMDEGMLLLA